MKIVYQTYITKIKNIMFKVQNYDLAIFKTKLFTYLYVRVCILLACGKTVTYLHHFTKRGDIEPITQV